MVRKCLSTSFAAGSSPASPNDADTSDLITSRKQHTVLSETQVLEIFRLKARSSPKGTRLSSAITSATVAKWYGVCSKTVRDIWMGRTWYRATHPLEPGRVDSKERLSKQPGRPRGAKDSRPRTIRNQPKATPKKPIIITDNLCVEDNCIQNSVLNFQNSVLNFVDNSETGDFIDPFHDDWPHW